MLTSFDITTPALNYVWANKVEVGSIHPNPFILGTVLALESENLKAGSGSLIREKFPKTTGLQLTKVLQLIRISKL